MSDRKKEMGRLADRAKRSEKSGKKNTNTTKSTESKSSEKTESASTDETEDEGTEETRQENEDTEETRPIKDRPAIFMYLPKTYISDFDLACKRINLTYQQETGEELAKNRYLYPIVAQVGSESAADLDYEEIQELVDEIDDIDAEEAKADE